MGLAHLFSVVENLSCIGASIPFRWGQKLSLGVFDRLWTCACMLWSVHAADHSHATYVNCLTKMTLRIKPSIFRLLNPCMGGPCCTMVLHVGHVLHAIARTIDQPGFQHPSKYWAHRWLISVGWLYIAGTAVPCGHDALVYIEKQPQHRKPTPVQALLACYPRFGSNLSAAQVAKLEEKQREVKHCDLDMQLHRLYKAAHNLANGTLSAELKVKSAPLQLRVLPQKVCIRQLLPFDTIGKRSYAALCAAHQRFCSDHPCVSRCM